MKKLVACCGLDCVTCDARIATIANDTELRIKTAEKWREMFNSPDISPEMINCTGCREPGVKFGHCLECEIRNCVKAKGFDTCADCDILATCAIVGSIHQYVPEAIENLIAL
ncbi:MAG: DUF3795 domain-containing protein [Bacteroidales bacterium]|jgi:hypothetical protein